MAVSSMSDFTLTSNAELLLKGATEKMRTPGSDFHKKYSFIDRCECSAASNFFRSVFEDKLIEQIEGVHPEKDTELYILSGGAGDCLEELVFTTKLLNKGYRKIDFSLIDPTYKNHIDGILQQQFNACIKDELIPSFNSPTINGHFYASFDDYFKDVENGSRTSFKVVILVDLLVSNTTSSDEKTALDSCLNKLKQNVKWFSKESLIAYNKLITVKDSERAVYSIFPWLQHSINNIPKIKFVQESLQRSFFEDKKSSNWDFILSKFGDDGIEDTFFSLLEPKGKIIQYH